VVVAGLVYAADIVPNEIQQPGTQPQEISNLESPDKCDNCHGGYNELVEPAHNWRGSMMANAGRDPIFWATLAVAEQDFDGAGDLCIRCHSTAGWLAGRSTPTDGSGLGASDGDGVECDFCHKMTNPDDSEHLGVQFPDFVANDGGTPPVGYYGSGMTSMWGGSEKLGPYLDPSARHQFLQSNFHRSQDFCGTCHDVSNPAVGDLADNSGAQQTADPVVASHVFGSDITEKAAFNNFPYQYGIVERTFSEYKSGLLSQTLVSDYPTLPGALQVGAVQAAYDSAMADPANPFAPDYADGWPRYFSCQTCHMRPVTGTGCNKKGAPVRSDLPLHDMTGGNYWMPEAIKYQDTQGQLRLGGGLTATQIAALDAGVTRAKKQLNEAASVSATYSTGTGTLDVKIVNLTGHKLISGYPEGRRMWLNIRWFDSGDEPCRRHASRRRKPDRSPRSQHHDLRSPLRNDARVGGAAEYAARRTRRFLPQLQPRGHRCRNFLQLHSSGSSRRRRTPRDVSLRAQQHGGQGQPDSAVRDVLRRGAEAQRSAGSRRPVWKSRGGRHIRLLRCCECDSS
jgi:hypothetical protein